MGLLIGMLVFFALGVWILVDMRRMRSKSGAPPRAVPGSPYSDEEIHQARYFVIGLACCMLLLAANEWLYPKAPPFTGRLSLLHETLYALIGPKAGAVIWGFVGIMFFLIGVFGKTVNRK